MLAFRGGGLKKKNPISCWKMGRKEKKKYIYGTYTCAYNTLTLREEINVYNYAFWGGGGAYIA